METAGKSPKVLNVVRGSEICFTLLLFVCLFNYYCLIWLKKQEKNTWLCWHNSHTTNCDAGHHQASFSPSKGAFPGLYHRYNKRAAKFRSTREGRKRWSGWMWLPDAFQCVGSTPGKRAVNFGDLSDEDIILSDFTLARINARNEALCMAWVKSLLLRVPLSLGSWTEVGMRKEGKQSAKEWKVVCDRNSISLSRWLPSPVI